MPVLRSFSCVYIYKFAVLFYCAERHKKTAAFIYLSTAEIAPPVADLFYFQQKPLIQAVVEKLFDHARKNGNRSVFVCESFPSFLQIGHLKNALAS
jgi:hypothetical protein